MSSRLIRPISHIEPPMGILCQTANTSISQVHREYLFTRDWTGLSILLGIVFIPLSFWQMTAHNGWIVTAFFIAEYLLVSQSACNHGQRFVASVLANKSASI